MSKNVKKSPKGKVVCAGPFPALPSQKSAAKAVVSAVGCSFISVTWALLQSRLPLHMAFSEFRVKSRLESAALIVSLLQFNGWLGPYALRIGISWTGIGFHFPCLQHLHQGYSYSLYRGIILTASSDPHHKVCGLKLDWAEPPRRRLSHPRHPATLGNFESSKSSSSQSCLGHCFFPSISTPLSQTSHPCLEVHFNT